MSTFAVEVAAANAASDGMRWTRADLDEVCRNFERLKEYVKPPVLLGGDRRVLAGQADGGPSLGWVSGLKLVGDRLIATLSSVPSVVARVLRGGNYSAVSPSLYNAWQSTNWERNLASGVTGKVLASVAFKGADVPEVRTLDDLAKFLNTEEPLRFIEVPAEDVIMSTFACSRASERLPTADERVRAIEERVRNVGAALDRIQSGQEELAARFTSFETPRDAQDVGPLAHTWLAELESLMQRKGLDMNDVEARRLASRELLLHWQQTRPDGIPAPADFERAINARTRDIADVAGIGRPPAVSRGTPERASTVSYSPGANRQVPSVSAARDRSTWGTPPDPAARSTTERGELGGLRERLPFTEQHPPLYGSAQREAGELAGIGSFADGIRRRELLHSIASAKKLRLTGHDRDVALREVYRRENPAADISRALTLSEAVWCLGARERLDLTEEQARCADLTIQAAATRPDLVNQNYGSGRDRPPTPARRPRDAAEAAEVVDREARLLLREQDCAATPEALAQARKTALAVDPSLAPGDYGSRGRRW